MADVLIDVDDTVAETQVFLLEKINALTDGSFTFEGMTRAHRENAPEHKIWNENVWELMRQPDEWAIIEPSPGAVEGFEELIGHGDTPHIVTARKSQLFKTTDAWLKRFGFWFSGIKVHRRRDNERGVEFKCRVADEIGFAAAFEDTLDVALELAKHVKTVYLIDKPWNRFDDLPTNVVRVASFADGVQRYIHG
jgi:uncharacterized HAD superfamily protein